MGLLELLDSVKEIVGHTNVRWDVKEGEVRIWTGLTMRDESGTVDSDNLRRNAATLAITEMGN